MKKAVWAGIIVLLGGAVITAMAIDGKKQESGEAPAVQEEAPAAAVEEAAAPAEEQAHPHESQAEQGGVIGAPTIEPVIYGKPDAPLIIEEFASFTCPHCAHFHRDTLPELEKAFLDKGIAQLQMYSYARNEQDLRASQLAYCVEGNEARKRFIKAIFQAQEQWAFSNDFVGNLRVMAQVGGVSNEQFDACMADKELEEKILRNRDYASGLGINSTPFFVIGKEEIKGARDLETFKAAIEAAQKKSQENAE